MVGADDMDEDSQRIAAGYEAMAANFRANGLDVPGIIAIGRYFGGIATAEQREGAARQARNLGSSPLWDAADAALAAQQLLTPPWPLPFDKMDPPLPPRSTRLLVVPLTDAPALAVAAAACAQAILRLLPPLTQAFVNARSNYHITVFHNSHPFDPRPDTLDAEASQQAAALPAHARSEATEQQVDRERRHMMDVVASTPPPTMQVERVVLAPSGTLLITWVNADGGMAALRRRLAEHFPGCTAKCAPNIIHTSLWRVLTPEQLEHGVIDRIDAACEQWTQKLRGRSLTPRDLWYIIESEFSTIEGDRTVMPLAAEQR